MRSSYRAGEFFKSIYKAGGREREREIHIYISRQKVGFGISAEQLSHSGVQDFDGFYMGLRIWVLCGPESGLMRQGGRPVCKKPMGRQLDGGLYEPEKSKNIRP